GRRGAAPLRALVDDLKIEAAGLAQEGGVTRVGRQLLRFDRRIDPKIAARQGDEGEAMRIQLTCERGRIVRVSRNDRGPELNAAVSDVGDVRDRLAIVAAPC